MGRTFDWLISEENSGNVWTQTDTLPRPNDDLTLGVTSTITRTPLADGSLATIIPETKYNYENLQFIWYNDTDGSIMSQIVDYVKAGTRIKITDHNSDYYIGYFLGVSPVWISGKTTTYDVSAIFCREND